MSKTLADILLSENKPIPLHKTAIFCQGKAALSYLELQAAWEKLKYILFTKDLQNQKRIGVLANSKKEALIFIGGIILSDNVYVPLDKNAPVERNLHIIEDNQLHALVLDKDIKADYKLCVCVCAKWQQKRTHQPNKAIYLYN